jgi:hypothetical protein
MQGFDIDIGNGSVAVVDAADFNEVSKYKWHLLNTRGKRYAIAHIVDHEGNRETVYMHRLIAGVSKGQVCDHIDGDGLNNKRLNLRACSHQQNIWNAKRSVRNKSGFKGVCWHKNNQKWHARISKGGVSVHLGFYESPEIAHQAYCKAAKELHGEFWRAG